MKAVSIHTDPNDQRLLQEALAKHSDIKLCRSLSAYPDFPTLGRVLRAWAPDMIFLDLRHPSVPDVASFLVKEFPDIRRVAIHPAQLPEVFRNVLHLEMHELVSPPFKPRTFDDTMSRVAASIRNNPVRPSRACRTVSFLPAKAGVGASTLAAHTTWAAAEDPEARVLLADFDYHSGVTSFLFNVEHEFSIRHALARGHQLDEDIWQGLVASVKNIDMLVSKPGTVQETNDDRFIPDLLDFAQRNYTVIHNDLPDSLDASTLAVLHQSSQIFLVTTLDLMALRIAKLKADCLRKLDLDGRVELLVNRWSPRQGFSIEDIENAVGLKVFATFPCLYKGVSNAIRDAKPAQGLMQPIRDFAGKALGCKPKVVQPGFLNRILSRPSAA